ncbi:unnamed protein product [Angiostrongylus costaricensis]|uniref:Uncharacterized protein n=1 Tax=Angiostrongylus costaricensis TaxID=334426 RepID=A0A0R3PNX6_ANGCS|nr:unnamed protein product [Angiostrongylus costaricensis]
MMVFCSLLEYAAVGYINKRMRLNEKNKKQRFVSSLPAFIKFPIECFFLIFMKSVMEM